MTVTFRTERFLFRQGKKRWDIFLQQSSLVSLAATCTAFLTTCPCFQPLSTSKAAVESVCRFVKMSNPEQDIQGIYLRNAKCILEQKIWRQDSHCPECLDVRAHGAHCLCYSGWHSAMRIKEKCWSDILSRAEASLIASEPCQVLADGREETEFLKFLIKM